MNQADIEKYAFLYFCGEKDRDILLENRKMTFEDLERFSYLTDLFGFQKYHAQIWNKFSGQFEEKFEALEHLYEESADIVRDNYISQDQEDLDDTDQQTQWKNDFLRNAVCHKVMTNCAFYVFFKSSFLLYSVMHEEDNKKHGKRRF